MNAMMLLGIQAVLISLLVRLISYTHIAESSVLHCQHCHVCQRGAGSRHTLPDRTVA